MFYRKKSNQYIYENRNFEIDGTTYPANWLNNSSPEEKANMGLEEVTIIGEKKDDRYYWVSENLNEATLTYVNTPKDLDQVKATATAQIKTTAYSLLQPNDYIEIRNIKDAAYKPEWITWRDEVRTLAHDAIEKIKLAEDVDEVASINVTWPLDPTQSES